MRSFRAPARSAARRARDRDRATHPPAAVVALEDDPLFNAGRGAAFNAEACHELDASIMDRANLRAALARDVAARIRYRGQPLAGAALAAVARLGGDGGLIAVDRRGNVAMPFNCEAMLRGCIGRRRRAVVEVAA